MTKTGNSTAGKLYGRRAVPAFGGSAMERSDPRSIQVAGDHYKKQGNDQPIELCFRRYGYSGVMASLHVKVDKYLTRDKDDKVQNLKKARHCIDLMIKYTEENDNAS